MNYYAASSSGSRMYPDSSSRALYHAPPAARLTVATTFAAPPSGIRTDLSPTGQPFVFGKPHWQSSGPRPFAPQIAHAPTFPAWQAVPLSRPYHLSPLSIADLLPVPELGFPSSPTDSSASSVAAITPPPPVAHLEPVHVVCAVPLLAPKPLPYHSPRFLQFDDLPDVSEDLSHAPYVSRPPKRKRSDEESAPDADVVMISRGTEVVTADGPSPAKRVARALPRASHSSRHAVLPAPVYRPPALQGQMFYNTHLARGVRG